MKIIVTMIPRNLDENLLILFFFFLFVRRIQKQEPNFQQVGVLLTSRALFQRHAELSRCMYMCVYVYLHII